MAALPGYRIQFGDDGRLYPIIGYVCRNRTITPIYIDGEGQTNTDGDHMGRIFYDDEKS